MVGVMVRCRVGDLGVGDGVPGEGGDVDRAVDQCWVAVELGEVQQVGDEPRHALAFLLGAAHGVVEFGWVGETSGLVELGVSANGGDGGAELVGCIGDELSEFVLGSAAFVERGLDPAEHGVERMTELARLGPHIDVADALGEVTVGDGLGASGHAFDGGDPEAKHPPGDQGERQADDGDRRPNNCSQPRHCSVDPVERDRGDVVVPVCGADGGEAVAEVTFFSVHGDRKPRCVFGPVEVDLGGRQLGAGGVRCEEGGE